MLLAFQLLEETYESGESPFISESQLRGGMVGFFKDWLREKAGRVKKAATWISGDRCVTPIARE